jgi:hypothetical protein
VTLHAILVGLGIDLVALAGCVLDLAVAGFVWRWVDRRRP